MKILEAKIDVKKISKEKLFKGEKGTYLTVNIAINDTPDQYGNVASIWENQSKEEREKKANRNYLGNAKLVWTDEKPAEPAQVIHSHAMPETDDLPF